MTADNELPRFIPAFPLPKWDGAPCVKCGWHHPALKHETALRLRNGSEAAIMEAFIAAKKPPMEAVEWMTVTCIQCGFKWYRAPLDATP